MRCHAHPVLLPCLLAAANAATASAAAVNPFDIAPEDTDVALLDEYRWVDSVSRRRQRIETTPQAVNVLLDEDLRLYPALNLPDRLRSIGGVDVYQSRHGQFDVGMRGFNGMLNPRILVTLGPLEFRQEEFGAVLWRGVFFASDVERVEVLKGPGSVTYGANAFGGVVAVREREPGRTLEVRGLGTLGSHRNREIDATAMGPLGATDGDWWPYFKLSAGATHLGDLPAVDSSLAREPNPRGADTGGIDLEGRRIAGLLGIRAGSHRFEVGLRHLDLLTWEMVDNLDAGSNDDPHRYNDLVLRAAGSWGEATHTWRLARNSYQNQKVVYDPADDFRYTQGATDNIEHVSRVQFPIAFGEHALSIGGEFRSWQSRSNLWRKDGDFDDESTWARVTTTQVGVFIEDQWQVAPELALTAGVRGDEHSRSGFNISPRVAANWNPDPDRSLLAAVSLGYRNPTPIESYLSEFYYTSNPDLDAEKIIAVELGWSQRIRDSSRIGINVFASRAYDLIRIMPLDEAAMEANYNRWLTAYSGGDTGAPLGPMLQFTNLATPIHTIGVEFSARAQVSRPLLLWGNATLQSSRWAERVRFRSDGFISIDPSTGQPGRLFAFDGTFPDDIDAPSRVQANLGIVWRDPDGAFASVVGRAVGPRRTFALSDSYLIRDDRVSVARVPGYAALDLALGWEWRSDRWLKLTAMDVFDSQHVEGPPSDAALLRRESEDQQISTIGRALAIQGMWSF